MFSSQELAHSPAQEQVPREIRSKDLEIPPPRCLCDQIVPQDQTLEDTSVVLILQGCGLSVNQLKLCTSTHVTFLL